MLSGINGKCHFLEGNCGAALSREEQESLVCSVHAMAHFDRCWNICAKPARGRVHPVAVVTASSRMSRNSRAGWPTVHHQQAPPGEGCPMCIHPDDRAFLYLSIYLSIGQGEQQHARLAAAQYSRVAFFPPNNILKQTDTRDVSCVRRITPLISSPRSCSSPRIPHDSAWRLRRRRRRSSRSASC